MQDDKEFQASDRLLKDYLQSWLDWVNSGAPEGEPYERDAGLCDNSFEYEHMLPDRPKVRVVTTLHKYLSKDNNPWYPFGGCATYMEEADQGTMHLNKQRMKWVVDTIAKLS